MTTADAGRSNRFTRKLANISAKYVSSLGEAITTRAITATSLRSLSEQIYLQEKYPSHMAMVYLRFDNDAFADRNLVKYVIEILEAEDLGKGAGNVSHAELARRFALFAGSSDSALDQATPTSTNRAVMDWCDMSQFTRPWREALAVQLACESQFDLMATVGRGLHEQYAATRREVAYWTVHGGPIERAHARRGSLLLRRHVRQADEEGVLYAYQQSSRLMYEFYESFVGVS